MFSVIFYKKDEKNRFFCKKKEKMGVFSEEGKWVLPPIYDKIEVEEEMFSPQKVGALPYFIVTKGKLKGVFDKEGKEVAPIAFQNVKLKQGNDFVRIKVFKGDKVGCYNVEGKEIVPPIFPNKEIEKQTKEIFFQAVLNDTFYYYKESGLIFKGGQAKKYKYGYLGGDYMWFALLDSTEISPEEKAKRQEVGYNSVNMNFCDKNYSHFWKYGVMSLQNEVILAAEYENVEDLYGGRFFAAYKNGKFALFNAKGQAITDFRFLSAGRQFEYENKYNNHENESANCNGSFIFAKTNKKEGEVIGENDLLLGVVDTTGKEIIPFQHSYVERVGKDLFHVMEKINDLSAFERLIHIRNTNFPWNLEHIRHLQMDNAFQPYYSFEKIENMPFLRMYNTSKDTKGIMNENGKIIVPVKYEEIILRQNQKFFVGKKEANIIDIYNFQGKKTRSIHADLFLCGNQHLIYSQKGKWQVCDTNGKKALPFHYDSLYIFSSIEIEDYDEISNKQAEQMIIIFQKDKNYFAFNMNLSPVSFTEEIRKGMKMQIIPVLNRQKIVSSKNNDGLISERKITPIILSLSKPYNSTTYDEILQCKKYFIASKDKKQTILDDNFYPITSNTNEHKFQYLDFPLFKIKDKKNKWGIYNAETKEIVIPAIYKEVNFVFKQKKVSYFSVKKGEKYALASDKEGIISPFRYQSFQFIAENIPVIYTFLDKKKSTYQLMDCHGKLFSTEIFISDNRKNRDATTDYINAQNKKGNSVFSQNGKLITNQYLVLQAWAKELDKKPSLLVITKNLKFDWDKGYFTYPYNSFSTKFDKIGLMDSTGKTILSTDYESIKWISNDFIVAAKNWQDSLYGCYDLNGKEILSSIYTDILAFKKDYLIVQKGNLKGVCNEKGEIIVPIAYEDISNMGNEAIKVKQNGKWGMLDNNGKMLIPAQYEALSEMIGGRIIAKQGEKCGILNANNVWQIEPIYEGLEILNANLVKAKIDCQYTFLDAKGHRKMQKSYDYIQDFSNPNLLKWQEKGAMSTLFLVGSNGKVGVITDEHGPEVIPCAYESLDFESSTLFLKAMQNQKYGIINLRNEIIVPFEFEKEKEIDWFAPLNSFKVRKNGLYGLIKDNSKQILPCEYEQIFYSEPFSLLKARKGEKYFFFDAKGNSIAEPKEARYWIAF
jgi:hypothetical protein